MTSDVHYKPFFPANDSSVTDRYSVTQNIPKKVLTFSSTTMPDFFGPWFLGTTLFVGLVILTVLGHEQANNSSNTVVANSVPNSPPVLDSDLTVANLNKLKEENSYAVLVCESKNILSGLSELETLNDPYNIKLSNTIPDSAKKNISYLVDRPAKGKYWEHPNCTYGMQAYDNLNIAGKTRAFVTVSRKCANPVLTLAYYSDQAATNLVFKSTISR